MTGTRTLEGARVLVTGGSGFIGSHITDLLIEAGVREVTVIDNMVRGRPENLEDAMRSGRVSLVVGDIRDAGLMDQLVAGQDVVFHQAALRITHCAAEPDTAMSVMVQATYDLLRRCVEHHVDRVVMASSASIYGLAPHFPTPESDPPYDNRTLYGAAKSFGEGLLRSFHDMYGLDYVALRYFNVYGPRMDLHGKYTEVMVRWMERLSEGLPPIVFGDGAQTMDLVHVRDVARANILAARSDVTDRVYNIGSGTETSLLELAGLIARGMGREDLVAEHTAERAVNPVSRRLACTHAAAREIGFRAEIGPDAGLVDLISYWRREREARPGSSAAA
ncbi:NAD-dependent epimerase/dehydratase family protein [Limimaricola variabilis]|uniref:NAD-dependent epimerase/dehydratase family protein n=1 Tax=Limimaricola variabilis TaxID=1492771 RepID=UPI002AC92DDD|nr:NAD-dependent epimerase/dehydratase family protein [Limimaricola variabilis]WPY95379.1 NAD-dependent epimerase/dehydratase family protein [Limimaricola variabilis]